MDYYTVEALAEQHRALLVADARQHHLARTLSARERRKPLRTLGVRIARRFRRCPEPSANQPAT